MAVNLGLLADYIATAAHVSRPVMAGYVRALQKAGLIPERTSPAGVDDAIWLLLALLAGSAQRVREIADTVNSRQVIGETILNDGDPAITLREGLRDVVNLRRAGALLTAADFRLVDRGGCFSATIQCRVRHPLLGPVYWCFAFGRSVEPSDPDPGFWRVSAVTAEIFDEIAKLFGPLQMALDEPVRWTGVETVPVAAAVHNQVPTVH